MTMAEGSARLEGTTSANHRGKPRPFENSCNAPDAAAVVDPLAVVVVPLHMRARLLFPNPVCLLTTAALHVMQPERTENPLAEFVERPEPLQTNVMTVSWLTPIDNHGNFVCSLNKRRYSLELMETTRKFVLNVPAKDMEEIVLAVGTCSGRDVGDKFRHLGIATCFPGWGCAQLTARRPKYKETSSCRSQSRPTCEEVRVPAVSDCIAHMVCVVQNIQDQPDSRLDPGEAGQRRPGNHVLIFARIEEAYARSGWWDGRNFIPRYPDLPPVLTFLGSKRFAYVRSQ